MHRVFLSIDDLARTRVASSIDPIVESMFAVETWWNGGGQYFRAWRRTVIAELSDRTDLTSRLTRIANSRDMVGDLLAIWTGDHSRTSGITGVAHMSQEEVVATIREFSRMAIEPNWAGIRARLDVERGGFRQIMSTSGVEALLQSLHPHIRWNAPVLEIDGMGSGELRLDGRGLLLSPSLFMQGSAQVLQSPGADRALPPTVVFPLRADSRGRPLLAEVDPPSPADQALAALVGRTRAATLAALPDGFTTSQLADLLGVSSAAVSQHTAVLRAAGLIATRRNRNLALHTTTPLGMLLLRGTTEAEA